MENLKIHDELQHKLRYGLHEDLNEDLSQYIEFDLNDNQCLFYILYLDLNAEIRTGMSELNQGLEIEMNLI